MPDKIKIGGHVYTIKAVEACSDNPDDFGTMDSDRLIIEVSTRSATVSQFAATLIHEVLHAIWYDRDLGKRPDEEKVVSQFDAGLNQIFTDNPKIVKWLQMCYR